MKTYRYRGHSRSDPAKYRPEGELERWKGRDPIVLLGDRLAKDGTLSPDEQRNTQEQTQKDIDAAAMRAAASPVLTLEETAAYVYAD